MPGATSVKCGCTGDGNYSDKSVHMWHLPGRPFETRRFLGNILPPLFGSLNAKNGNSRRPRRRFNLGFQEVGNNSKKMERTGKKTWRFSIVFAFTQTPIWKKYWNFCNERCCVQERGAITSARPKSFPPLCSANIGRCDRRCAQKSGTYVLGVWS